MTRKNLSAAIILTCLFILAGAARAEEVVVSQPISNNWFSGMVNATFDADYGEGGVLLEGWAGLKKNRPAKFEVSAIGAITQPGPTFYTIAGCVTLTSTRHPEKAQTQSVSVMGYSLDQVLYEFATAVSDATYQMTHVD